MRLVIWDKGEVVFEQVYLYRLTRGQKLRILADTAMRLGVPVGRLEMGMTGRRVGPPPAEAWFKRESDLRPQG